MATAPFRHVLVRALVVSTAALVGAGALPAATSSAEPRPALAAVANSIAALRLQADAAVEDYDAAVVALQAARRTSTLAAERVARARARTEASRARMASFAAAAYRSGGTDQFASLILTSDPATFLDRAGALDQIARNQADVVRDFQAASRSLADAEAAALADLSEQQALERRLAARRDVIERSLKAEQALLARLQPAERQRLQAAEQATDRAASASTPGRAPAAGRGRGGIAVRFVFAQLGKPYHWGSSGPGSYDCSGLTMAAWAAAGVHLPHSSGAQFVSGTRVSQSSLTPGDLVFYGRPIHHVGIYVGGGRMISSPHTGTVVKVQNAFRSDFVGAVRP